MAATEGTIAKKRKNELSSGQLSGVGSWSRNMKTGEVEWSDHLYKIIGLPTTTTASLDTFLNAIHPDDRPQVQATLDTLVEDRNRLLASNEYRISRGDGESRYVQSVIAVSRDEEGRPLRLEGRVEDVTERRRAQRILGQRAVELETVMKVSAAAAAIQETQRLLQEVVDLTSENFDLYHSHIYLLDPEGDSLVLAAGAGDVGRQMVAQGRTIPFEAQSLVARAARTRAGVTVNNVREADNFLPHPLLPRTRSELAVPMIVGERLEGVLDVQSERVNRFGAKDVDVYSALAAQVAVALENARSLEQARAAMADLDALTRRLTREGWERYAEDHAGGETSYLYDGGNVAPMQSRVEQAPGKPKDIISPNLSQVDGRMLSSSLVIRGETIGRLAVASDSDGDEDEATAPIDGETAEIVAAVAEQLSARIENLRLSEQTEMALGTAERQARRLADLNEMGAALGAARTMQEIFRLAAIWTNQIVGGERTALTLLDRPGERLVIYALEERSGAVPLGKELVLEDTPAGQAIREGRLIYQRNLATEEYGEIWDHAGHSIHSTLIAPLSTGDGVIGTINVGSSEADAFDRSDENLMRQLASLMASTIENRRLTQQTEEALGETEALYGITARLNAATTAEEIIEVIGEPMLGGAPGSAGLYLVKTDEENSPEWAEKLAAYGSGGVEPQKEDGTRLFVPDLPISKIWFSEQDQPIFIEDLLNDARVDPKLRDSLETHDGRAMVVLPLTRRGRWLGVITASWREPQVYDSLTRRFFSAVRSQASLVVERWLLLNEVRERAEQLEQLAQIEAELSQATGEGEILKAGIPAFNSEKLSGATLSFIGVNEENSPHTVTVVASWGKGRLRQDDPFLDKPTKLSDLAIAPLREAEPPELLHIADVFDDPRVDPPLVELAQRFGYKALTVLNMYAAGRWQGALTLLWTEQYHFSDRERFFLEQLAEPLAATVASRRAYLAQQEALEETRVLYRSGDEINRARTYEDVLQTLRRHTIGGREDVTNLAIALFDEPWTRERTPVWYEIADFWSPFPIEDVQERLPADRFPSAAALLQPDAPSFIEDLEADERVDKNTRRLFMDTLRARSVLFVPLWVGGQWIGYVSVAFDDRAKYSGSDMQRLTTLVGQAAVTIQSIELLEETNRLLASEQRQRRVADTLLRASSRMSGILEEGEIREILLDEVKDLLQPHKLTLYEWSARARAFRPALQRGAGNGDGRSIALIQAAERPDLWQSYTRERPDYGEDGDSKILLPWFVGNRIAGILEAVYEDGRPHLREEDRSSLTGLVQQTASRLQGARLFEETEKHAEELAILNKMEQELTALTDVGAVAEMVYRYAERLVNTDNFYIALFDAASGAISFPVVIEEKERVSWPPRKAGKGLTEHVIHTREPLLLLENVGQKLDELGIDRKGAPYESWLGTPMVFGGRVIGVIVVQSPSTPYLYREHDMELLNAVAGAAATAIQNARLFQETQARSAETRALYEASRAINTSNSYEKLLKTLRAHTVLGEGAHHVSINYFDRPWTKKEKPQRVEILADYSELPEKRIRSHYALADFPGARLLLKKDGPMIIEDIASRNDLDDKTRSLYLQQLGAAGVITAPLVAGDQWVGFVSAHYSKPLAFGDEEVAQLSALAGQAAVAVQSMRLLTEAQQRARREQLLREVTARVRGATDVDVIMKTAVREVGRVLGREAFVYLGEAADDEEQSNDKGEKETR